MDLSLNLPLTCLHDSGQDPNMSPPPTQLIILLLSYVHSCRHDSTPPIVLVVWENRQQIWCGAALHVCANVTKWKGMQIGDLITSRPLLHPAGSNVSLAEKFPACFSCTIIHLSTALRRDVCSFTFFIPSRIYNTQDTEESEWLVIRVL